MTDEFEAFRNRRKAGNEEIVRNGTPVAAHFFELDSEAYASGALPARTKELLGLTISLATRCEECVFYHLERCVEEGVSRAEIEEVFALALVGVGSILVPTLRAAERLLAAMSEST